MIGRIAHNDWRNLRADRTLWAVGLLLTLTIAYGVRNGAEWTRFQNDTLRSAFAEEKERLDGIRRGIEDANAGRTKPPSWRDPRSAFSVGYTTGARYVFMTPAPLSSLAVGQSDLLPYYYKVSLRSRDTILGNDEVENPVHLLAGRFDLAFVIIYLYPLLILALSYNLISSEKEDGTLAMTLAQPVSLRAVAAGKIGFRGLFVLTLATAVSLAGFLFTGADLTADGAWSRFLMWTLVVAAYGAFWFAAAVAVNAFGRSSSTNALALAGMWLAFVVLVPSLLNVVVKAAHPVPSRVDMIQAMRVASDDVTRERSRLMAKYLEDHPELAGATQDTMAQLAVRNVAMMEEMERRVQPVLAQFDEQLARQQSLVDRYRYLSPAILTQSALYDLAGTSSHRYKHFVGLTEGFHRQWRAHFNPLMLRNVKLTPASIDRFPRFEFREEPLAAVVARVAVCVAGLAALTLIAGLAAFRALKRYPLAG
jgi:ABC-2 type transport system permease protein